MNIKKLILPLLFCSTLFSNDRPTKYYSVSAPSAPILTDDDVESRFGINVTPLMTRHRAHSTPMPAILNYSEKSLNFNVKSRQLKETQEESQYFNKSFIPLSVFSFDQDDNSSLPSTSSKSNLNKVAPNPSFYMEKEGIFSKEGLEQKIIILFKEQDEILQKIKCSNNNAELIKSLTFTYREINAQLRMLFSFKAGFQI